MAKALESDRFSDHGIDMSARGRSTSKSRSANVLGAEVAADGPAGDAEPEAPRTPQQDRGQRRVDEILDAAEAVVLETGWDGATTQAIADRAGSSMGSLFHFFPTRDAILVALGRRCTRLMYEANERAMPPEVTFMEPHALFERIVRAQAELAQATPVFSKIHEAIRRKFGLQGGPLCEMDEAIYVRVRAFCATRLPRLDGPRREATVRMMVGIVHQAMEQLHQVPPDVAAEVLEVAREILAHHLIQGDRLYGPVSAAG
jgi:AcrR family transcriptional regulator